MGVQNSQLNFGMDSILKKNILMSKTELNCEQAALLKDEAVWQVHGNDDCFLNHHHIINKRAAQTK